MDTFKFRQRYMYGMCDALAIMLHEALPGATGYGALFHEYEDEFGETVEDPFHAFVYVGTDHVADCWGIQSLNDMIEHYPLTGGKIVIRKLDEEGVRDLFTTEEISDELIEQARNDALKVGLIPGVSL